jgi:hypothetical protein
MTTPTLPAGSHSAHQAEVGRGHLARIYDLQQALGGRSSAALEIEEDTFRIREGYQDFRVDEAEPASPLRDFHQQPEKSPLELAYFGRTLQLTQLIGHFVSNGVEIPVHYCITGAIILSRSERKFHVWGEPKLENYVLLPKRFVKDPAVLEQFESADLQIKDTVADRAEYTQMRICAVRAALVLTRSLRHSLYQQWRAGDGAEQRRLLVLSGNIFDIPNSELSGNVVAIDPQFYAPWQNSALLEPALKTELYNRSQLLRVSKPGGDDGLAKYMWYVRLRKTKQAVPEFGLLRCMIVAEDEVAASAWADAVSTRLLDERIPVTFPAHDWDRLIFPVKLCQDYLESMIPSRQTVRSYFARD